MSDATETRLVDDDGARRFTTVAMAIVVGGIVTTLITAAIVYQIAPSWGAGGALGVGAMVGFWSAPLTGGVAGNGLHELRSERNRGSGPDLSGG